MGYTLKATRRVAKKVTFGLLTTLLFVAFVEVSARVYHSVRSGSSAALRYGDEFAMYLLRGHDLQKEQFPFRDPTTQEEETERAFRDRNSDRAPSLVEGRATVVLAFGIPSRRNRFGYRGEDFSLHQPAGVTRITTLGGSFVFGGGLLDEQTWPYLLQQYLNQQGARSEVVNLGISGANVHDVLVTLIKSTRQMAMDYALIVSAYNNHPLLRIERRFTLARKLDFYLYNLSIFHVLVKEKLARLQGQPLDYGLYRRRVHVDRLALQRWTDVYKHRLEQLHTVCREHGIRLVLMAQPYVFYDRTIAALDTVDERQVADFEAKILSQPEVWEMELAFYLQGRQNVEMKRFAAERGALFFDGVHVFPADLQPLFWDTIHPNVEGSRMLAAALTKFFASVDPQLRRAGSTSRDLNGSAFRPSPAPTASLARSPSSGTVGVPLAFDASASSGAATYSFDYGDGVTDNAPSPRQTHAYATAGNYTVRLMVMDTQGRTATTTSLVTITP
jgi:lysophospholipase L1-like esterase